MKSDQCNLLCLNELRSSINLYYVTMVITKSKKLIYNVLRAFTALESSTQTMSTSTPFLKNFKCE